MTRFIVALVVAVLTLSGSAARTLEIWFVDVEGGQATLIVTPAGESMLIDAGYSPQNWRGATPAVPNGRDPSRILAAVKEAGLSRIDYLLITHFHPDHVGGVPEIAAQMPIGTFIDYGAPLSDDPSTLYWYRNYEPVRRKGKHVLAHAGDRLPLQGLDADIVSAAGMPISKALRGGGQKNAGCAGVEDFPEDGTENYRSIGVLFRFGAFRFLDLGDLSGNTLTRLACPENMIGPVSVYLVAHHGDYDSNIPALYAALRPRVAIINNGVIRGGDPEVFRTLRALPAVEDFWQLHYSENQGAENAQASYIANVDEGVTGYSLRLSASDDGSFTVVNPRNGFTKAYARTGR